MIHAEINFNENVQKVRDLGGIYDEVVRLAPLLKEQASQILRSQFVLIVSAFDTYIHDIVRIGILQQYEGTRPTAKNLSKLSISYADMVELDSQSSIMKLPTLDRIIRNTNSTDSYQSSTSVEYALGLIGVNKIWSNCAVTMGCTAEDVKRKLNLIVRRRNQIAHESDYNPVTGDQFPIDKTQVENTILFIADLVNAIKTMV